MELEVKARPLGLDRELSIQLSWGPAGSSSCLVLHRYKNESPIEEGEPLGDGTQAIHEFCETGDVLLSGGPANIAPTTTLLESFPTPTTTTAWTVRVNMNGHADSFSVVVPGARQVDTPRN